MLALCCIDRTGGPGSIAGPTVIPPLKANERADVAGWEGLRGSTGCKRGCSNGGGMFDVRCGGSRGPSYETLLRGGRPRVTCVGELGTGVLSLYGSWPYRRVELLVGERMTLLLKLSDLLTAAALSRISCSRLAAAAREAALASFVSSMRILAAISWASTADSDKSSIISCAMVSAVSSATSN